MASSALVLCFFSTVILMKPLQCLSTNRGTTRIPPAMFTFGASLIDVGTNKILNSSAQGNQPFNGIDCDPPVPNGRISNCWVVADWIAKELGFDESPPPFLSVVNSSDRFDRVITSQGVSFGSSTSGIFNSTGQSVEQLNSQANVPVGEQINQFRNVVRPRLTALLGQQAADNFLAQSIFLLATGSGDIDAQRANAPPSSDPRYLRTFTARYVNFIRSLYAAGARKFFIVAVPLLGCSPFYRISNSAGDCDARLNSLSRGAYRRLANALRQLYRDFQYSICNSPNLYFDAITNAPSFPACGLREVRAACCGNGRTSCRPTSVGY